MKMCEFYLSQKGCVKGLQCDFLHPVQPGAPGTMRQFMMQAATAKICSFYHSPRGCVKGLECDFLHVTEANRQQWAQGMAIMSNAAAGANSRMFNNHQSMGGSGDYPIKKKAQICQFIGTARGCVKGDLCDFIHKKERPCDFHLTPRGCRKGDFCDFQHSDSPADSAEGASTPSQGQQRDTAVAQQMPAVAQQIPVNHYR